MGDKGADIPCAVATVTNNIIPTGVRRRHGITRSYTYLFISMEILYKGVRKKKLVYGSNPLEFLGTHKRTQTYVIYYIRVYITIIY